MKEEKGTFSTHLAHVVMTRSCNDLPMHGWVAPSKAKDIIFQCCQHGNYFSIVVLSHPSLHFIFNGVDIRSQCTWVATIPLGAGLGVMLVGFALRKHIILSSIGSIVSYTKKPQHINAIKPCHFYKYFTFTSFYIKSLTVCTPPINVKIMHIQCSKH